MSEMNPVEAASAGARAIEAYFAARNITPTSAGDGRYVVYIPGKGEAEDLQLSLASTPAARGILARVKARRSIPSDDWGRALVLVNKWNRSCPLPHATLNTTGDAGAFLLEGALPPAAEVDEFQFTRFVETVILGARQFWSGGAVLGLAHPRPATAAAE